MFGVCCSIARFKQRVSFYIPPTNNLRFVLDAAKVADSVLFVTSPNGDDGVIDDEGDYCLKCLMGQGMPSALFVCHVSLKCREPEIGGGGFKCESSLSCKFFS